MRASKSNSWYRRGSSFCGCGGRRFRRPCLTRSPFDGPNGDLSNGGPIPFAACARARRFGRPEPHRCQDGRLAVSRGRMHFQRISLCFGRNRPVLARRHNADRRHLLFGRLARCRDKSLQCDRCGRAQIGTPAACQQSRLPTMRAIQTR